MLRIVIHALKVTFSLTQDVLNVYQWKCALSITLIELSVLMILVFTSVVVITHGIVQTMYVYMGLVGMAFWRVMRNVRLEELDAEDASVIKDGILNTQRIVILNVGMGT